MQEADSLVSDFFLLLLLLLLLLAREYSLPFSLSSNVSPHTRPYKSNGDPLHHTDCSSSYIFLVSFKDSLAHSHPIVMNTMDPLDGITSSSPSSLASFACLSGCWRQLALSSSSGTVLFALLCSLRSTGTLIHVSIITGHEKIDSSSGTHSLSLPSPLTMSAAKLNPITR